MPPRYHITPPDAVAETVRETVFIDGKLVMDNRKILTVDEDEIMDRCAQLGEAILKRSGVKVPGKWPIL